MAREFVMGARLTLEDDFSRPIREAFRATEQFREATADADSSASQLNREIQEMGQAHRQATRATDQAAQAIEEAARSTQELTTEQNQAGNEAQQMARIMQQLAAAQQHTQQESRQAAQAMQQAAQNMNQAAQKAKELAAAARQSSRGMEDAAQATNSWGSRLISLRTNIAVVGTAIAGMIAGFMGMQAVDGMLGRIQAMTGKTAAEAQKLTEAAKAVYSQGWGESIPEVANDMGILQQQLGHLSTAASKDFLESSYIIKDAFGAEVTDVTKTVGNLVRQFGDLSETKALDMITKGFQSGANISDDFLDTLNEYAVQFKGLGFTSEQAFGTLIAGSKSGAFMLDKVGDSVKESFIRMQDFSKTSLDAYDAIGLNGMEMSKKIAAGGDEANAAYQQTLIALAALDDGAREAQGIALFGTQWEDVGDSIIPTLQAGMKGLDDFDGATARAGEALRDNLGTQAQAAARGMLMAFTTAAQPITEVMTSAFKYLNDNMESINAAAEDVATGIQATFDALTASASFVIDNWNLIGPLIEGVGAAWLIYGGYLAAVKVQTLAVAAAQGIHTAALFAYRAAVLAVNIVMMVLRGQFVALWATMMFSPIGLVVTALGLLLAAGILIVRNWDTIKAAFVKTFAFMAPYLEVVKQAFVAFGIGAYNAVVTAFGWIATKFKEAKAWGAGIIDSLGPIGNAIQNSFNGIGNVIATLSPLIARLGLAFLGVSGPVGWVIAGIITLGAWIYKLINNNDSIKASFLSAWESIKAGIQPVLEVFGQIGQTFAATLQPAIAEFAAAWAELAPEFQKTGQAIAESFTALGPSFQLLGQTLAEIGPVFAQIGAELLSTLVPALVQLATTVVPIAVQLFGQLASTWLQIATAVLPLILTVIQTVLPMVLQIITTIIPVVIQVIMTIVPVILQIVTAVIPLILQVVQMVFPIVMQIIQTVIPIVIQIIMLLVPIILMIAQTVIPLILQAVQLVFPIIMAIIGAVIPVITAVLQGLAAFITGVLVPTIKIILKIVEVVFSAVSTFIQNAIALVTGIIQTGLALIQGDWEGAWNSIKSTAETIMNNIIDFFKSIDLFEIGGNIISGLINGISNMKDAAINKVKEVGGAIKDTLVGFFDINSPSKVMRMDVGRHIGGGLIRGIDDSIKGITAASTRMAEAAYITPNFMDMSTVAANAVQEFQGVLRVATIFDGAGVPDYASNLDVPASGSYTGAADQPRGNYIAKLVEKIELIAGPGTDAEELLDQFLEKLYEKLQGADEILGADRGALL